MRTLAEFPFAKVAGLIAEGKIVPFLGAAASRVGTSGSSALPDGRGLADELISEMGGAFSGSQKDNLAKVSQLYEHTVFGRPLLYDYLKNRFQTGQAAAAPSRVASLLATMPASGKPLFIITTNYDSFIERAFRSVSRPICVITQNLRQPDPAFGAARIEVTLPDGQFELGDSRDFQWSDSRFDPSTVFLFKMHGSVHNDRTNTADDVIITEDDYVDFIINAGGPATSIFPPASLAVQYRKIPFLFLGYSLSDWNFRIFLRLLAQRNALSGAGQGKHFAIQRSPDPVDEQLWEHRNVNVYDGDLAKFCDLLEDAWAKEQAQ